MKKELEHVVEAALSFCHESENVRDNSTKLLAADKLGAAECTRVGDECAQSMKVYGEALEVLKREALRFITYLSTNPIDLFEDVPRYRSVIAEKNASQDDKKAYWYIRVAFSALRFVLAEREFALSPTAHRSHGPQGREVDRFFRAQEKLLWWYRHPL